MHTFSHNELKIYSKINKETIKIKTRLFYATEIGIFYVNDKLLYYFCSKKENTYLLNKFDNKILSIFCSEYLFVAFDGVINKYSFKIPTSLENDLQNNTEEKLNILKLEKVIEYNNTVTHIFTNDIYLYIISPYLEIDKYNLHIMPHKISYDKIESIYGKCYESSSFLLIYNVMIYILINKDLEFLINLEEVLRKNLKIIKLSNINNLLIVLIETFKDVEENSDDVLISGRKKIKIVNESTKEIHLIDLNINKSIKCFFYDNYCVFKEMDKYLLLINQENEFIKEDISFYIRSQRFVFKKSLATGIKPKKENSKLNTEMKTKRNTNLEKLFDTQTDKNIPLKSERKTYIDSHESINNEEQMFRYLKYKENGSNLILKRVTKKFEKYKPKLFNLIIYNSISRATFIVPLEISFESKIEIINADFNSNLCAILLSDNTINILNLEYLCEMKNLIKIQKVILGSNKKNILKVLKIKHIKELNISSNKIDNRIDFINTDLLVSSDSYLNFFENIENIFSSCNETIINTKSLYLENIIQQRVTTNHYFFLTKTTLKYKLNILFNEMFLEEELEGEVIDFFITENEKKTTEKLPWFLETKIYLITKKGEILSLTELIKCTEERKNELIKIQNPLEIAQYISSKPVYLEVFEINFKDFISVFFQRHYLFGYERNQLNETMNLKRLGDLKTFYKENSDDNKRKGKPYNPFK